MGRKLKENAPVSVLHVAGLHESSELMNGKKRKHDSGKEKLPKAENARMGCSRIEEVVITGSSSMQKKEKVRGKDTKKKEREGTNEMHSITIENGNCNTLSEAAEGAREKKKQKAEGGEHGNNDHHPADSGMNSFTKKNDRDKRDNVKELPICNGVAEITDINDNAVETGSDDGVIITGENIDQSKYKAIKSFTDSQLPIALLQCCWSFTKPSPIQAHAWPFLLDGRDFVGIAATGSGKTLAFGIPAINHVLNKLTGKSLPKRRNPHCLVLSPTRELAQQIFDVVHNAGKPCGVVSVCLYGGTSKGPQVACLESGVDIIIATPGRLKDMMKMGFCILKEVSFVVLDEADRMLDMGFEPEVRSILCQTSPKRQMAMFSATWPLPVHLLAREFMNHVPVKVVVGSEDLSANHDVMQIVEVLEDRSRDSRLLALLTKYHKSQRNRVLVFVLYKKEASRVECMLGQRGWKAVSIHGDKSQPARTEALSLFRDASCPLMVATDVAARGLDIPDVEVVINYSFPLTTEDYVHRIGRTGRAGKKGVAHTFFTKENKGLAGELVNVLREAGQVVPPALLNFGTHVKRKESTMYGAHFREISADAPKAKKITFSDSDDEND